MRAIDAQYLETPFYGSRKMAVELSANRKRVRRLMRVMGLEAIYRKPRTTQRSPGHKIYPYLLRNLEIRERKFTPVAFALCAQFAFYRA